MKSSFTLNITILGEKNIGKSKLINDCGGEKNNKPLKTLLDIGMKLENYCPKCYIEKKKNIHVINLEEMK